MRTLLTAVASASILSSCTLTLHYQFNDDMSGSHTISFDMGSMAALTEEDSSGQSEIMAAINADSLEQALNARPGISNAVIAEENGVITAKYDFAELEVLNGDKSVAEGLLGASVTQAAAFRKKGRKLFYTPPRLDQMDVGEEAEELGEMSGMLDVAVGFVFDKPIKKVKNPDYRLSSDGRTATFKCSYEELSSGDKAPGTWIKMGK